MDSNNLSILGDQHTTIVLPTTPMSSFTIIRILSFISIGNPQNQPSAPISNCLRTTNHEQMRLGSSLPELMPLSQREVEDAQIRKNNTTLEGVPSLLQGLRGYPCGGRSRDPHGNMTINKTPARAQVLKQGLGCYCRGC